MKNIIILCLIYYLRIIDIKNESLYYKNNLINMHLLQNKSYIILYIFTYVIHVINLK